MPTTLMGTPATSSLHLLGLVQQRLQEPSMEARRIQERIVRLYLMPLAAGQWDVLRENACFMDGIATYLHKLSARIPSLYEFQAYMSLLKCIRVILDTPSVAGPTSNMDMDKVMQMVYQTTAIRLRPEYEVYISILGRPTKDAPMREDIVSFIREQLRLPNALFPSIKARVLEMVANDI